MPFYFLIMLSLGLLIETVQGSDFTSIIPDDIPAAMLPRKRSNSVGDNKVVESLIEILKNAYLKSDLSLSEAFALEAAKKRYKFLMNYATDAKVKARRRLPMVQQVVEE